MVRPTIKQQREMAQKSRKTKPEPSTDTPELSTDTPEPSTDTPELSTDTPEPFTDTPETPSEMPPETPGKRDKQVTVKFSDNDMDRLKAAANKARRPVANLLYSLTMEYVESIDKDD